MHLVMMGTSNTHKSKYYKELKSSNFPPMSPSAVTTDDVEPAKHKKSIKKKVSSKINKSGLLTKRIAALSIELANMSAMMKKVVYTTERKVDELQKKIEDFEKKFDKKDRRHEIGFLVA